MARAMANGKLLKKKHMKKYAHKQEELNQTQLWRQRRRKHG
jgi:hypothetical protein